MSATHCAREHGLRGWERLRHDGLLLDGTQLDARSRSVPGPLDERIARQLRQRAGVLPEAGGDSEAISAFVAMVLEQVCGLDASTGVWARGSNVASFWGRRGAVGVLGQQRVPGGWEGAAAP